MTFETNSLAANMAKRLVEHPRYTAVLGLVDADRILFLKAVDKKAPSSLPTPVKIEAVNEKYRSVMPYVFIVTLYNEWFSWPESKQYCALLQQLLRIETMNKDFEDGKLTKYDLLELNYMVDNFGLHWTHQDAVRHPIDDPPVAQTTFQGSTGIVRDVGSVQVVSEDELSSLDEELEELPLSE